MASIKDTGTGGINLDGDVYTMDVFEEGTPEDTGGGKYGKWNSGEIKVDKSKKDISTPTKETFAKYLSKTTLGKQGTAADLPVRPNPYPVGIDDSTKLREVSLRDVDGNPMKPSITPNESSFAPEFNQTIGAPNGTPVKKGYSTAPSVTNPDGNILLRNAAIPADVDPEGKYVRPSKGLSDPLKGFVSQVLKVNRFNPNDGSGGFVPEYLSANSVKFVTDERFDENSSFVNPDKLKFGTSPGNNDSTKREYGFKRLAKIAPILQKNATYLDAEGGSTSQSKENSNLSSRGGNLSSSEDLSQPIERLNIENVIRNLPEELIKSEELTDFSSKFETTLNNVVDRFSSFSNETQAATAAALVSGVFNAFKIIEERVETGNITPGRTARYRGAGRQGIGSYYGGATEPNFQSNLNTTLTKKLQFMNMVPTSKPYKDAVIFGINSFYKINNSTNLPTIGRPNDTVNYSIILSRSIIRSLTKMSMLLKEINEVKNINQEEKSLEIMKTIRDSRLVGIFNFFAQIGDIGTDYKGDALFSVTEDVDNGRKISMIDSADDNLEPSYGKSRLYKGRVRKLAWATNQTTDLLLASPTSYFDLSRKLDGPPNAPSPILPSAENDPTKITRMIFKGDANSVLSRIPQDLRETIEWNYNSEYVPFYFHDVRTNEIVGFHAFILSLSEDYSASYDSVEGFGRVEPVRVYKNTQRKISLSFIAAALDSKDFDALWFKINKLTTLMYPQYTSGKRVSNDSYSFVKPFTQAIGASPLVRLRVGNLITTNYSKFNLSKIFGLHENDTVLNDIDRTGKFAAVKRRDAKIAEARKLAADSIASANEAKEKLKKELESGSNMYSSNYLWWAGGKDTVVPQVLGVDDYLKGLADTTGDEKFVSETKENFAKKNQVGAFLVDQNPGNKPKKGDLKPLQAPKNNAIVFRILGVSRDIKTVEGQKEEHKKQFVMDPIDPQKAYPEDTQYVCKAEYEDVRQELFTARAAGLVTDNYKDKTKEEADQLFEEGVKKRKEKQEEYLKNVGNGTETAIDGAGVYYLVTKSQLSSMIPTSIVKYEATIKNKSSIQSSISEQDALLQEANRKLQEEEERFKQEYEDFIKKGSGDSAAQYAEETATFMDPRNNVIVRSFKSAGGEGLAGFIESLQFDWMAGTWDTSDGRKAPQMCKITMSFTPVHDIPPGLSSDGQNRAPIYQLGVQRPKIPGA